MNYVQFISAKIQAHTVILHKNSLSSPSFDNTPGFCGVLQLEALLTGCHCSKLTWNFFTLRVKINFLCVIGAGATFGPGEAALFKC